MRFGFGLIEPAEDALTHLSHLLLAPKYAIQLVVDIAIKALSPAVNDPTTAVQALDQIEALLLRLGRRRLDIGAFCDRGGNLRLFLPFPAWEDFLRLAFEEIRAYGANS